jgi:putative FmdB family regulatory protein
MPTYEYACRSCGHHVEVVQSFTDPALSTCPECGGELRKVFGNVGIVLKGSGFYKTDSRSATGKKGSAPKPIGDAAGKGDSSGGDSSGGSGSADSTSTAAPSGTSSGTTEKKSGATAGAAAS